MQRNQTEAKLVLDNDLNLQLCILNCWLPVRVGPDAVDFAFNGSSMLVGKSVHISEISALACLIILLADQPWKFSLTIIPISTEHHNPDFHVPRHTQAPIDYSLPLELLLELSNTGLSSTRVIRPFPPLRLRTAMYSSTTPA